MAIHKIYLNQESNPKFYGLVEEYNSLMTRCNANNNRIQNFRIPRILLFDTKTKLQSIGRECYNLQQDFLDWNKRAANFALHPHYTLESEQNGELVYTHFTDSMRHTINSLNDYMMLLSENYNKRYMEYENQKNFIIAITAFLIGVLGLLVSSYGVFTTEESITKGIRESDLYRIIERIDLRSDDFTSKLRVLYKNDSLVIDSLSKSINISGKSTKNFQITVEDSLKN